MGRFFDETASLRLPLTARRRTACSLIEISNRLIRCFSFPSSRNNRGNPLVSFVLFDPLRSRSGCVTDPQGRLERGWEKRDSSHGCMHLCSIVTRLRVAASETGDLVLVASRFLGSLGSRGSFVLLSASPFPQFPDSSCATYYL